MVTKMMDDLKKQLELHEGFRKHPYKCTAGKVTIGFGRNLDDVGISRVEAGILLEYDVLIAIEELEKVFPNFSTFTDVRRIALIDMMFNLGASRFVKFKKMILAIRAEHWEHAASEAVNSRWYSQVGDRAKTIVNQLYVG